MGSRFILIFVFSTTLIQFLPILREEGMLGSGWQYLGSDSSLGVDVVKLLPVGVLAGDIYWDKAGGEHWSACLACIFFWAAQTFCLDPCRLLPEFGWERGYMMIGFVNKGDLYPRFAELVSKMGVDDFLGQESIQRYKLDLGSSDRERFNSTLSTVTKPGLKYGGKVHLKGKRKDDSVTLFVTYLLHVFFSCFGLIGLCPLSHSWAFATQVFHGKPCPEISPLAS